MPDPIATDDVLISGLDLPIIIDIADLLANDSDPDGDPLSLTGFTQPANGTVVDNGDGTLTYTPNAGFVGIDSFGYTVSDGNGGTDTASVALEVGFPAGVSSDDFSDAALDAKWTLQGPTGTATVTNSATDAYLALTVAAGDNQPWGPNTSTRVMQAATDEDFGIEAKFLSTPTQQYQMQGLLVEQDANNWIRYDTYSDGVQQYVFAAVTLGGVSTSIFNVPVANAAAAYLRIDRSGDLWTLQYSADGQVWTTAGSFTQALTVSATGVFAGNAGSAPGFTAEVDYFFNTAAPIVPEDAIYAPPVAQDDAASVEVDTPLVLDVAADLLANDSDPNGDPLSLTGFTQAANGTVVDNGDGTFTYTPNAGFLGADSFTYTISDGNNSDTATVNLTVADPLAPPVAADDTASVGLDTPLVLNVAADLLANDSDPNGDALSLAGFDQPANGVVVDNGDGTLTYTPNAGFVGIDSFSYTISDGNGGTDTASVALEVGLPAGVSSDDFSDAALDAKWTLQGPTGTATVTNSATDAYLALTVAAGNNQPWGPNTSTRVMQAATDEDFGIEAKFLSTPTQQYQMQGLLVEQDANNWIRYDTYSDGTQQYVFAAVTLGGVSTSIFNVPVANAAAAYLRIDRSGDLWTLQYSADGQVWTTAGSFTQALTVSATGVFAGNAGSAPGFTAEVDYFFNTAAPIVPEDAIYAPPVAQDDAASVEVDTPLVLDVAADLLANDSDPNGDPLSLTGFTQAANGTVVDNGDGTFTYTPNAGFLGADSFTYTISDGNNSDTATVNLTVADPLAPPVAADDTASVGLDTPLVLNVAADLLANDSDPNGDALSLAGFDQPANGVVVDNGDGTLTYTPNAGFVGIDSFSYTISDGNGGTDTASVALEVGLPAGVSSDDFSDAALDAKWTLQGPTGTATVTNSATDAYLALTVAAGNNQPWGPNTSTRVMQAATDEDFGIEAKFLSTPTQQYQMQGLLVEQDANNWIRYDTYSDGTQQYVFAAVTLGGVSTSIFNVPVANAAAAYLRIDRSGDLWTLQYSADGQVWTTAGSFTQALTVSATGVFAGNAGSAPGFTAEVDYFFNTAAPIVPEDAIYAPPVAQDDAASVEVDTPLVLDVAADLLANDSDPNGDPLSLTGFTQAANGTVVDNGDGTFTYTPNAGFLGADSFTYTISDGNNSDTATVNLTVADPLAPPVAADDTASVGLDTPLVLNVAADLLANDSDPNGDALSLAGFDQPANGVVVDNGDGTLTYTPNAGFVGIDSFSYTISDGNSTDSASVTLEVGLPAGVSSDDFSDAALGAEWSLQGPVGTASIAQAGNEGYLEIAVPAGGHYDAWGTNTTARVMQEATNEDFGIEAKFLSNPTESTQIQGLLIEQDGGNWIRFDTLHDGANQRVFAAVNLNGLPNLQFDLYVAEGVATYLRVDRVGDLWTLQYSADGQVWTTAGSFTHTLNVSAVGVFAGSTAGSPGYTAQVDYFFNTAAPIVPEDDIPVAPDALDDIVVTALDTPLVLNVANDLLANDSDLNGDPVSLDGFAQPINGTLIDNGDGTLTYLPIAGFVGVDQFTYTITDGTGTPTDTATVYVGVANTAPVAQQDIAVTDEDTAAIVTVLANDSDPDGDAISIVSLGFASNGTVAIDDNGTPVDLSDDRIIYTPNVNFNGADSFTYTVGDGVDTTSTNVAITVNSVPDNPIALDDTFSIQPNTSRIINVAGELLINDSDGDGDPLSLVSFTQPLSGSLIDNGDGTLTYTPGIDFIGSDSFTYTITDGTTNANAGVEVVVSDAIDVWYGNTQTFGSPGEAQTWINILGNVDISQVSSLSYSLNGGVDRALSLGPNTRRLQDPGDFNIDIDYDELNGTAVDDIVTINATLLDGSVFSEDVTVVYEDGNQWASDYSIDWATVADLRDVVQVVDGLWSHDANGVRPVTQGYDRLLTLGDQSWDYYEVNLSVTMHDLATVDPNGRDGGAFAFGMLWDGHTDVPIPNTQPKQGYEPGAAFFFSDNGFATLHSYYSFSNGLGLQTYAFTEGSTYEFRIRVEQSDVFDRTYSIKYWEQGTTEPVNWLLQGTESFTDPTNGSLYLNAHYFDVTFGDLTVTEIVGSDILVGDEGDEVFVAVDLLQSNPGINEIDVFTGDAGADTFVFGDASGVFYDDANTGTSGLSDYGLIWDFETGVDQIQLGGAIGDYTLANSPAGLHSGTAIYHVNASGPDELIGVVNDVTNLSLASNDFIFIGLDPDPPIV